MFSFRALKSILPFSLLVSAALQAQQPVDLDDTAHTFSSIKVCPQSTQPRKFSPYLVSGVASYLLGSLLGGLTMGTYLKNSTLPWWQAEDKALNIAKTIVVGSMLLGLYTAHTVIQRDQEKRLPAQAKVRAIVGDSSFLDAIKTDNTDHVKAWLTYDEELLNHKYGQIMNDKRLKYDSLPRTKDSFSRTPIMLAAMANSTNVLELLLKYCDEQGSKILNDRDNQGCSALHRAVESKHYEAVKLLLKHDADTSIKNNAGKIPADLIDKNDRPMRLLFFPEEWSPAAASALGIEQKPAQANKAHNSNARTSASEKLTLSDAFKIGGFTAAMVWLIGQIR